MTTGPERISDLDLLALVEGDLPDARRGAVDRSLRADPALEAAVGAMRADRSALQSLGRERLTAPGGLVARALEIAQRDALLGEPEERAVLARIGPSQWGRLALAAALFLVAGVSWVALRPPALRHKAAEISADALAAARTDEAARDARRAPEFSLLAAAPQQPAAQEASLAGALPLREALQLIDDSGNDLSDHFLSLEVLQGQPRPVAARTATTPRVSPASYSDALSLATLNRLNLRVKTRDPEALERALRAYSARMDRDVHVTAQSGPAGAMRYAVETDRDESELSLLVAALRGAGNDASNEMFFDVPLLPSARGVRGAGMLQPVQVTGGTPRVSLPVVIERVRE